MEGKVKKCLLGYRICL